MTARTASIVEALGGWRALGRKVSNVDQLTKRVRDGLPYATLESLMAEFRISSTEAQAALNLPARTISRRKKQRRLQADESDRLVRLAHVAARAAEVLGDKEKAARWLHRPNRALANQSPLSILDTELGARQVEALLTRIEHGVFS
jgi:putative toxin-antitoxin system antitoxin component (TIGR02293 family)